MGLNWEMVGQNLKGYVGVYCEKFWRTSYDVLFVYIDNVKWLQVLEEWSVFPTTKKEYIKHIP